MAGGDSDVLEGGNRKDLIEGGGGTDVCYGTNKDTFMSCETGSTNGSATPVGAPEAAPMEAATPAPAATPAADPTPDPDATPAPEPTAAGCDIFPDRVGDNLHGIAHWFGISLARSLPGSRNTSPAPP